MFSGEFSYKLIQVYNLRHCAKRKGHSCIRKLLQACISSSYTSLMISYTETEMNHQYRSKRKEKRSILYHWLKRDDRFSLSISAKKSFSFKNTHEYKFTHFPFSTHTRVPFQLLMHSISFSCPHDCVFLIQIRFSHISFVGIQDSNLTILKLMFLPI